MSNKKILQGHNKALESLATIAGIPLPAITDLLSEIDCTKYEQGSFTLSADSTSSQTVNHSMGVVPKYYIVWTSGTGSGVINHITSLVGIVGTTYKDSASIYMRKGGYIGSYGSSGGENKNSEAQCYLYIPGGGVLIGGVTYNYLLLG